VLRPAGGGDRVIRRSEIDELTTLETSIMPEGLESLVTVQDCADILAAMRASAAPSTGDASR
jgi:hypothetical protein